MTAIAAALFSAHLLFAHLFSAQLFSAQLFSAHLLFAQAAPSGAPAPDQAAARQARFTELLRTYPERPPEITLGMVARLVDQGPFAERDRAVFWLGSARLSLGDREGARRWYERLRQEFPGSVWVERSWLGMGDAAGQERRYTLALQWYGKAARSRDEAVRELARISAGQTQTLRTRQRRAWLGAGFAGAVVLFFAALLLRAGARPLLPLPAEARIALPVLAFVALLSLGQDPAPRAAVLELCAGGAVLVLLSGMVLRARPLRAPLRIAHALLALSALGAFGYAVLYQRDLVGMVQETFRAGPE